VKSPGARVKRLAVGLAVLAGVTAAVRLEQGAIAVDLATARDLHGGAYAGSLACRGCHPDHYRTWYRTFHRTMTAEATGATVRGDFSGATLTHAGVVARMDRDERGGFRMTFTPAAGGPPRAVAVARTVGSRRYQQYLAKLGDTYWRLPVAYHVEERRWFPMTGAFLFPSEPSEGSEPPGDDEPAQDDPLRPVFGGGVFDRHVARWNDNCVFCHNVAPNPGRDPGTGGFRTTVAELGVACEACHGPGAEHARRNADPVRRYALTLGAAPDPTIVDPARLSPARAADLCGRCHGQRLASDLGPFLAAGDPFVAGDDLAMESEPLWRDTPLRGDAQAFAARFWPDGTPRLTAYEYQGLLQSPCAQRGTLTCTSCHGMHEGDPRGQVRSAFAVAAPASGEAPGAGDGMCTRCHRDLGTPAALARHSHHDPGREGARCVACHMPRVVYGVLDIHRSHRIEIPDPARAAGATSEGSAPRPDACTLCHVDRTPGWAAGALARWRGGAPAPPPASASPVEVLFSGEPLARAVAADAVGRAASFALASETPRARALGALLEVMARDRYPAVRHLAWRAVRRLEARGAGPDEGLAAGYDASAGPEARAAEVALLQAALGSRVRAVDPEVVARLRARAVSRDVQIGE